MLVLASQLRAEDFQRFIITGNLKGAIKDCKCPNGQPGGLARRVTIIRELQHEAPHMNLVIDCGRITGENPDELELVLTGDLYTQMGYDYVLPYYIDFLSYIHEPFSYPFLPFIPNLWEGVIPRKAIANPLSDENEYKVRYTDVENRIKLAIFFQTAKFDQDYMFEGNRNSSVGIMYPASEKIVQKMPDSFPSDSLSINIRNLIETDEYIDPVEVIDLNDPAYAELDLLILGGGGYIEPEVIKVNNTLVAHPGIMGGHVLAVDIWTEDGHSISAFEWQAIPTASALPDSSAQAKVNAVYDILEGRRKHGK